MTDTYFITCDNGEHIHFNGAACFMPMKRLANHCGFVKGLGKDFLKEHKVKSLTYMVDIDDHDLMSNYVSMIKNIKPFSDIITNIHTDNGRGSCWMTVRLDRPVDAVLYTIGAMRYIKERNQDQDIIKKFLDVDKPYQTKDAGLKYLLMEGVKYDKGKFLVQHDRGHSNTDEGLTIEEALNFDNNRVTFGTQKPYDQTLTYGYGWGHLLSSGRKRGSNSPNFFESFCRCANANDGATLKVRIEAGIKGVKSGKVTTVSKPKQYGNNPCAQMPWPVQEIRRGAQMPQIRADAAIAAHVPKTIRVGKLDVPINENTWIRRLNPKRWLHATNRQKLYQAGYRAGFRLRK